MNRGRDRGRRRSRSRTPVRRGVNKRRDRIPGHTTIIVSNLADDVTEEDVLDFFLERCGRVEGIKKIEDDHYQIKLFDEQAVDEASKANGESFKGRRLNVDYCLDSSSALGHPFRPSLERKSAGCQTLFVGNIPESATEEDLRSFFLRLPDCPVVTATLRRGGFKGMFFAHVKFSSPEACERASTLAGNFLRGSRLRLDWAQDKALSTEKSSEDLRGRTPRVFLGNIPDNTYEEDVERIFSKYGPITSLRLHRDRNGVKSFGYLTFATESAADAAVSDGNNLTIRGSVLRVDFARQDRSAAPTRSPAPAELGKRHRSASPERQTKVSFEIPEGYGHQPDWEELYARY